MDRAADNVMLALRDILDSIVSAALRDTLIAEALEIAQCDAVPTDSQGFQVFLRGPLLTALERALGDRLGRAVAAELEPLVQQLPRRAETLSPRSSSKTPQARAVRPRKKQSSMPTRADTPRAKGSFGETEATTQPNIQRPELERARQPTIPARPHTKQPISDDFPRGTAQTLGMTSAPPTVAAAGNGPAIVFVVTRDLDFSQRFNSWLDQQAAVIQVSSLTELLLQVTQHPAAQLVLLFDAFAPVMRAAALAAIQEDLPTETRIVVWGGLLEPTTELTRLFPRVREWLICTEQVPLSEVVDRCRLRAS